MRPIDGDYISDALEAELCREGDDLEDRQWAYGYAAGVSFAVRKLAEAPTLTPPNEWVSVEERLPKPDIDVLLYFGDSAKLKMAVGGKYELDDGWYSVTDGEYYTDCDTPPIYWMPLPEEPDRRPPEGEEEP